MVISENILQWFFGVFVFLIGSCIGSFLNVVAYRIPYGISVVTRESRCPNCDTRISPLALIPMFGYLLIQGKCTNCKAKISPRYPIVEFISGLGTLFLFFHFLDPVLVFTQLTGVSLYAQAQLGTLFFQSYIPFFSCLWLLYSGIALTLIDIDHRILPDVITLPGIVVGFVLSSLNPAVGWKNSLYGIVVGGGLLFTIAKLYEWIRKRDGMGLGDVKYLAFLGAITGWQGVLWTIAVASLLGTVYGILTGILRKEGLQAAIPFGPFLALGALIVTIWGQEIQRLVYPPLT